eukprot:COSAG04_NODE_3299_length_2960_cov_1.983572_1_plen_108_part_00
MVQAPFLKKLEEASGGKQKANALEKKLNALLKKKQALEKDRALFESEGVLSRFVTPWAQGVTKRSPVLRPYEGRLNLTKGGEEYLAKVREEIALQEWLGGRGAFERR